MQQYQPNTPSPAAPAPGPSPVLPPPSPYSNGHKREGLKSIITTVLILLIAPILALGITAFVFQSYEVDGPSMNNTLATHDRLIIWKAGRTWSRITDDPYMPKRGTVVVFVKKGMFDFDTNKEKQLIKRIIGLPGDRVVIKDGSITVYSDEHPDGFNPDENPPHGAEIIGPLEDNLDITVPEGEMFVVGDNRANSYDSRSFGTVPLQDIVGTLTARILPLSEAEKF